jgi:hypothetical protein
VLDQLGVDRARPTGPEPDPPRQHELDAGRELERRVEAGEEFERRTRGSAGSLGKRVNGGGSYGLSSGAAAENVTTTSRYDPDALPSGPHTAAARVQLHAGRGVR